MSFSILFTSHFLSTSCQVYSHIQVHSPEEHMLLLIREWNWASFDCADVTSTAGTWCCHRRLLIQMPSYPDPCLQVISFWLFPGLLNAAPVVSIVRCLFSLPRSSHLISLSPFLQCVWSTWWQLQSWQKPEGAEEHTGTAVIWQMHSLHNMVTLVSYFSH